AAPIIKFKDLTTATGYTVGGGIESYMFDPSWSVKVEYQLINLGSNEATLRSGANICHGAFKCEDDAFHTVRAGINYHFGADGGYKDGPAYASVNWAGWYAGVNGGYGWSEHSDKFAISVVGFKGIDPHGGFGGGQIGYNWQSGYVVFGVEADIQGAAI